MSGTHSPPCGLFVAMRVIVISASTGGLVWDCTSGSFRQARGWELRMWLCDAINCTLYFSVVLFTREMLLCDMAYISEYAEGNLLTVYMLRREIDNPSDYDTLQVETALRFSDRLGLGAVASRGIHMRFLLPEMPGSDRMVNPLVLAIQSRIYDDPDHITMNYPPRFKPFSGLAVRLMILASLRFRHFVMR